MYSLDFRIHDINDETSSQNSLRDLQGKYWLNYVIFEITKYRSPYQVKRSQFSIMTHGEPVARNNT